MSHFATIVKGLYEKILDEVTKKLYKSISQNI